MRDRNFRLAIAVLAGIAVIYFGVSGHRSSGGEGGGISGGLILLALGASLLVWYLTRPGAAK